MAKEKIDQVLEEIGLLKEGQQSLKEGQQSLKEGQQSLKEGQQRNYDLIQKNGVRLEELASDIKAVAEGHAVIRKELQDAKSELKAEIKDGNDQLRFVASTVNGVDRKLDAHLRVAA